MKTFAAWLCGFFLLAGAGAYASSGGSGGVGSDMVPAPSEFARGTRVTKADLRDLYQRDRLTQGDLCRALKQVQLSDWRWPEDRALLEDLLREQHIDCARQ